ncbi:KIN3 [Candida pseudojiufengensis]|uniref:KIN3 n=1 Tax=Candida pseudojiufengensis TaxID=497109 RepID=UPI002224E07C|nr:KIN3 [Candida pseudojiufengensis]KAI5965967.1 KIN3 [Candida pseudojiufengensis]
MNNEYEALEVIGKGSYGTVRKVRNKLDNSILVRKEIEYKSMNNQERNQIISELRILKELNHKNIVKYYAHDHIVNSKTIHIYMEYCSGGDLSNYIREFKNNNENVPEEFIWQVLVHTLSALYRCHYGSDISKVNFNDSTIDDENRPKINSDSIIIHRDIKPDNIFVENDLIKLGDFGLAKMLTTSNDFAKTYVGTPYYMSPEVLMDEPYSPVCDIWSLGCVLYELCNLQPPFQAKTHLQLQAKIKRGNIPSINPIYTPQLRAIIKDCITVDPEERPTCYDLMNSLSIKFLRKEMELNDSNISLRNFQKELLSRTEELKRKENLFNIKEKNLKEKEIRLNDRERRLIDMENRINERENRIIEKENKIKELETKLRSKENQINSLENSLIDEFNIKKQALDLESKEIRLFYQTEFWSIVEKEVNERLKSRLKGPQQLEDLKILKTKNLNLNLGHQPLTTNLNSDFSKFRVTDEYERQRNMEIRKYRIN